MNRGFLVVFCVTYEAVFCEAVFLTVLCEVVSLAVLCKAASLAVLCEVRLEFAALAEPIRMGLELRSSFWGRCPQAPAGGTFLERKVSPRPPPKNFTVPTYSIARIASFGRAPTALFTTSPFFITTSVGMLMTWNFAAKADSSSTLTLPTTTSSRSSAI